MKQQLPDESSTPTSRRRGPSSTRQIRLIAILAVSVAAISLAVALSWPGNGPPNFACVDPGVLYRSGQPGASDLRLLVRQHGIRTSVNLRSPRRLEDDAHAREEMEFARKHKINLIYLPYWQPDVTEQAQEFLRIMAEPSNFPLLVHCAAGEERSGVMVAVYRMAVNGWSAAQALREMEAYGFEPEKEPAMAQFVETYVQSRLGGEGPREPEGSRALPPTPVHDNRQNYE